MGTVKNIPSKTVARIVNTLVGVALSAAAFFRGHFLLGFVVGVIYLVIGLLMTGLFVRTLTTVGYARYLRLVVVATLSLALGFAMAFPATINPDMQYFINDHATDRAARTELALVFASDPSFRDLSVSTTRLKSVNIELRGSLGSRPALDLLQARIREECPTVAMCVLHWNVTLRDSDARITRPESELK